ncbi:MAG: TonB-dependent receptor, partial [Salinivirgaceae bacterium]
TVVNDYTKFSFYDWSIKGIYDITKKDTLLNVRYLGYKQFQFNPMAIKGSKPLIRLEADVKQLQEIVYNYIAKGVDKLPDGSIQLNVRNMEILPGLTEPDILHTVQVLPGIQSFNETVSDINIRGGINGQNLVLWEGMKMYQTGHFFGLISAVNSHLIHQTRIIKNGASASYMEGVSGIIDMKQQDYLVTNFEANAGLNMISSDAIIKVPINKKFSMIFGVRHSINNLISTPTYTSYYNRAFEYTDVLNNIGNDTVVNDYTKFSFYDWSIKGIYDITKKDKIRFSILSINNNIEYEESTLKDDTAYSQKSRLDQFSFLSGIDYSHSLNDKHSVKLSSFIYNYNLNGVNVSLFNEQEHLQKNQVIDWGLKLNVYNKLTRLIDLSSGYHYNEIGIRNQDNISRPNYKRDVKDVLRVHSLYSEVEANRMFDKMYARFGLRANYFQQFKRYILEPRAILKYRISDHISIETLAESKSQYTTQLIDYQSDFLGIEKRRWVLSNNNSIPIIRSRQLSLGVNYKKNSYLISLEAYKKVVRGIITPSQGFQNQYQYVYASGNYETQGVELLMDKRFRNSNVWANYSYSLNDYYFQTLTPSTFPNNVDVRHILSIGGSYRINDFEFSGAFNYRTGRPFTKPKVENGNNQSEIIYEDPNSSRLRDYVRLDVSGKYNFIVKKIKGELGLSIWNVLNRKNDINIFYQRNDNNEIEKIVQHALQFTPNLSFRLFF